MIRKSVCLVAAIAVLCTSAVEAAEVFSFSSVSDTGGFNGAIDAPSDSGDYTLTTATPTFLQENGSVVFMYQAGGPGGLISSTLNVLDLANNQQLFNVNSIDWRAFTASGGGSATVTGYLGGSGGTQQWQLAGPQDLDPPVTFSSPTTGDFGQSIDTIVWSISMYQDGTFGNTMDNVNINVVPEPASLALLGMAGAALLFSRKRCQQG